MPTSKPGAAMYICSCALPSYVYGSAALHTCRHTGRVSAAVRALRPRKPPADLTHSARRRGGIRRGGVVNNPPYRKVLVYVDARGQTPGGTVGCAAPVRACIGSARSAKVYLTAYYHGRTALGVHALSILPGEAGRTLPGRRTHQRVFRRS